MVLDKSSGNIYPKFLANPSMSLIIFTTSRCMNAAVRQPLLSKLIVGI